ncbi:MAG: endonuclease G [Myxococcota bacterium]|jgi:endonuclease G
MNLKHILDAEVEEHLRNYLVDNPRDGLEGVGQPDPTDIIKALREGTPLPDEYEGLEAIVLQYGRPAYLVKRDKIITENVTQSEQAKAVVEANRQLLEAATPRVGRIDLKKSSKPWVGTGWVIAEGIVVTNRHVAREFAKSSGGADFRFLPSGDTIPEPWVDFGHEHGVPADPATAQPVTRVLWIEPDSSKHDVALLEVPTVGHDDARKPIPLATDEEYEAFAVGGWVSAIGYPAFSGYNSASDQSRIFDDIYNIKRLQPGTVTSKGKRLEHDCTTLGGNSGSVILDVERGTAVALHFGGFEGETNFAVPAPDVRRILAEHGTRPVQVQVRPQGQSAEAPPPDSPPGSGTAAPASATITVRVPPGGGRVEVPITLTVQVEVEVSDGSDLERVPDLSHYEGRQGYDRDFLSRRIPLPDVSGAVARFGPVALNRVTGGPELPYTHFSVLLSERRRLAYVTAVNIDGRRAGPAPINDVDWARDARVDRSAQVENDLYAERRDYFQRGHMVRRLDPVWGPPEVRQQANDDTYHWTNCAPQHRGLNTGHDWRTMEDNILDTADAADLRASVFTGPVFHEADEEHRGVQIPKAFYKIVVHETPEGGLASAGWVLRQDDVATNIPFETVATPTSEILIETTAIAEIEAMTGLRFDPILRQVEVGQPAPPPTAPTTPCNARTMPMPESMWRTLYTRPELTGDEGAADTSLLWGVGQTLKVRFLDGTPKLRAAVIDIARTWERHANLRFDFGDHPSGADIRISFDVRNANGGPDGYWSYLGRQTEWLVANGHLGRDAPTMSLSNRWRDSTLLTGADDIRRVVLHEFGHAIGLIHEHQSPRSDIPWNREAVYRYYEDTQGWSRDDIDTQVLSPDDSPSVAATPHDPTSIMQYPVPQELTHGDFEVGWNNRLSEADIQFIGELYPHPDGCS